MLSVKLREIKWKILPKYIKINDSIYTNINRVATYKDNNTGITAIIPIDHLENKIHTLKIGCTDIINF